MGLGYRKQYATALAGETAAGGPAVAKNLPLRVRPPADFARMRSSHLNPWGDGGRYPG